MNRGKLEEELEEIRYRSVQDIRFNNDAFIEFIIPPANEVAGVYSDPYVRPSVCPSQSLIRYSSKTAEQNFMKLSGIVYYMMPYCTFAIQNMGEQGVLFCEHCSQYF